jgi:hypothetical protein
VEFDVFAIRQIDAANDWQVAGRDDAGLVRCSDLQREPIQDFIGRCQLRKVERGRGGRPGVAQHFEQLVRTVDRAFDILGEPAREVGRVFQTGLFAQRAFLIEVGDDAEPDQKDRYHDQKQRRQPTRRSREAPPERPVQTSVRHGSQSSCKICRR